MRFDHRLPLWLRAAPVLFLLLWSGGYVTAKIALQYAEPMTLLTLRYAWVIMIMAALFLYLKPRLPSRPLDWAHLAIVGFLLQAVYFGFCYLAFRAGIAVGTLALLFSLQPVLVALVAPRWSGETIRAVQWAGLILGLVGTGIVIAARAAIEIPSIPALTFALLGLIGIAGAALWEKRFGIEQHPVVSNLVGYAAGIVVVLPLSFLLETREVTWNWSFTLALAYLVVGNSVIAVGLLLAMIRQGDVSRVSALFFLVPPMAALIAWLVMSEEMPGLAWFGMVVAAAGVYVATKKVPAVTSGDG